MWTSLVVAAVVYGGCDGRPCPGASAAAIDGELERRFAAEGIVPAPRAGDAEFLRRVSLDLIGRIPAPAEIRSFLSDPDPGKREALIARLLDDAEHAQHFARVWRSLLLPEAATDRQVRYLQPGLEAWLREHRDRDSGFDVITRELLAVPVASAGQPPQMVLTDLRAPNPLAYIASKEADPAKLAAATARLFLGIRLECAQCHDHPFDRWTHADFWSQAAFFAGLQRKGSGPFAPLLERPNVSSITPMESQVPVSAAFLTASGPVVKAPSPRVQLAEWMTSAENRQFAQALANRLWGQLFGVGLVDPVDDFHDQNPPSHPEILDLLAEECIASGFDLDHLYATLCLTRAYQRTSRQTDASQAERTFSRMAVKAQSGDQFFDSLAQAVGYASPGAEIDRDEDPVRRTFLDLFADQDSSGAPETSVATALALMNGAVTADASTPGRSPRLAALTGDSTLDTPSRIEALLLLTVSRPPDAEELSALVSHVGPEDEGYAARLGDVFWMLLNSTEFRWNH